MSDRKHNHEKKEKQIEMGEMDKEYMEMPVESMQNMMPMQHNCPMMNQCPMMYQCPMMSQPSMQMPYMQGEGMRKKEWFEEWDEFSEDSSFEFESEDFYSPEKYYEKHNKKHNKNHQNPYFWPPYFPGYKK